MIFLIILSTRLSIQVTTEIQLILVKKIMKKLYLNLYDVDSPDSASEVYLNISLKEGLLIQDFNEREVKGLDKDFHYINGYQSIKDVWKNGCPN